MLEGTISIREEYLPIKGHMIDRFDILSETDLVLSGIERTGFVGNYPLLDGFEKVLPGFLVANKSNVAVTDKIMWDIREKPRGIISRITIGFPSSLYAINGFVSLVFYSSLVIVFFIFLLSFLVGSDLNNNVLGVFFITKYLLFFTEKTFEGLLVLLLRDLPVTIVQVYLMLYFLRLFKLVFIKK